MVANTALNRVDGVLAGTSIVVASSGVATSVSGVVGARFACVAALSGGGDTSSGYVAEISDRVGLWALGGSVHASSIVARSYVTLVGSLRTFCDVVTASSGSGSGNVNNSARISRRRTVGNGEVGVGNNIAISSVSVTNGRLARLEGGNNCRA